MTDQKWGWSWIFSFFIIISSLGISCQSWAQSGSRTVILSDFDGVFIEDRNVYDLDGKLRRRGAFKTRVVLFRQELREHSIQEVPSGPETVEVDWETFTHIRRNGLLAQGPRHLGNQIDSLKDIEGNEFYPGEYELRQPASYKYYFEADEEGRNYLLEDFKEAEKLSETRGYDWRGRHWKAIEKILNHEETARHFGIITARGHSIEEWKEFFRYLKRKGYIKYEPNYDLFHPISRPDWDLYTTETDFSDRKARIARDTVLAMRREEPNQSHLRVSLDGPDYEKEPLHTLVLIDDTREMIEAYHRTMRGLVTDRRARTKVVIIDLSLPQEEFLDRSHGVTGQIPREKRPRYSVITSTGRYREALPIEVIGEGSDLPDTLTRLKDRSVKNPWLGSQCGGCNPCARVHH